MSGLDQILLDDIAANCPQEFLKFHQCLSNPSNPCSTEQINLSKCIKTQVPSFQKIQGICAGKLQAYEACLKIKKSQNGCKDDLQELRDCAMGTLN
ncbi:mitochondrial intermembrane space cysteine motif-containing protein Mix14p [[Candida] jaroonii]|uniref:Mitochondrial intermembrane space cysteine motif-containing protein Mix14p n=1 Tax=[Candida] jaroonii TaxID=467808 RepID=A0ACA9YCR8_9ASCO|nr:mitochondrial intermembrane space cysteine motif-containing protein Mix14p [[Candida] jaroonii]